MYLPAVLWTVRLSYLLVVCPILGSTMSTILPIDNLRKKVFIVLFISFEFPRQLHFGVKLLADDSIVSSPAQLSN